MNRLILALALLLSQTAVAVHDIHCLDQDHNQMCEVYFTQDHNASNDTAQNQLEPMAYGEKPDSFTALNSPAPFAFPYLSRAPPKHL